MNAMPISSVLNPIYLDPLTLGWRNLDKKLLYMTSFICIYHIDSSSSIYVDLIAPVANVICYYTTSTINKYFLSYLLLDGELPQLQSQCCSSSGVTMRKKSSKCSRRYSCRGNNVDCAELSKFGGGDSCNNITPPI